jgi:hypothetical protein
MLKTVFKYASLLATTVTSLCVADCQTTFEMGVGYRGDLTTVNVDGVADNSNQIYLKNRFKDQNIFTINAKTKMIDDWFYFRAAADYGWITSGKIEDRFSSTPLVGTAVPVKSNGKIKRHGSIGDVVAAVGYPFEFCCGDLVLAPVVGYAYHYQNVKGHYRLSSTTDEHFNAKGTFKWYGPLLGGDVVWRLDDSWSLWGEFQYVFAQCKRDVTARGDDATGTLRHRRTHNGWGFDGSIGADYFFACDWYAGLSVDFRSFGTRKKAKNAGTTVAPLQSVDEAVSIESSNSRLGDKVRWTSVGINLNIGYLF